MRVSTLKITEFRNLACLQLSCAAKMNLVVGANASGKTSLLEALCVLGRGRSFRTHQPRELIREGASAFRLMATMRDAKAQEVFVGIERSAQTLHARVNGVATRSLAELARWVPVLLLNPDSHCLLEDGPRQRRRFMDWGLFHTEPAFIDAWQRYEAALRHRNAALRAAATDRGINAWDGELSAAALLLDHLRESFCNALKCALEPLFYETLGKRSVEVNYRRGWPLEPSERDFISWLHASRAQDRRQGHTRIGPHRADFVIRIDGRLPGEALSRGQQKLLVIALVLAQAELYRQQVGDSCILLIDDLPAELDCNNRRRLMDTLAVLDLQLFVTAIEPELLEITAWPQAKVFYLQEGCLR